MQSDLNDKIGTYLGFCIRAGKLTFGVDNAEKLKGAYLLVADMTLGNNSMKVLMKLKEKFACPLMIIEGLGELLHRPAVKAAAVGDKNLAAAIVTAAERDTRYKIYSGGNN